MRERAEAYFEELQARLCAALEELDGGARFGADRWTHAAGAGGGLTRALAGGRVFEKAGVNTSALSGTLTPRLAEKLAAPPQEFHAAGISLVLHPASPMVPIVHMNLRRVELNQTPRRWFGGGADLTPCYLFEEDAAHFHRTLRAACDRHDPDHYPRFKRACDEYFLIRHRGERRGVGGIFFDYLEGEPERTFDFVREVGDAFLAAYVPIVRERSSTPYGERERQWQRLRRGRYVEFNLIYDRGTLFGLETEGRAESILMSLPPLAGWSYDHRPEPGSAEAALVDVLRTPREWA
ncbi:MAG TPA: oxygen-dependent coproporphyrinogen oxidase [Candidatus Polarisedimenticolaceae bacterium]|nr:oxygen-dependent coproporphyrinogen oxidase [Candidatus Polarisedimenticolaceae bacterium]